MKASSWSPKPSLMEASTHEGLDILALFHLHQHHSTSAIKTHLCNQGASQQLLHDGRCPYVAPGQCAKKEVRCNRKAKIETRGKMSYGQPHPHCLPLTRSWIWEWLKFSINFFISVIEVWEIRRFQASTLQLTAPPGIQRPYENQPASLQGQGHKRYHHIRKLALGLNSVSLHWVSGSHPSPLCYSLPARLYRVVSEKFGDRHHPGWCTHHTGWAL